MHIKDKVIVVNALFIRNGGPLVILKRYIDDLINNGAQRVIVISSSDLNLKNIKISVLLIKNFKKFNFLSIFYYLFYGVRKIIRNINYDFIISFDYSIFLNKKNINQYLYIHNAISLLGNKEILSIMYYDYKYAYYKYLYPKISSIFLINRKFIIVQQGELAKVYEKKGYHVTIQPPSLMIPSKRINLPVLSKVQNNNRIEFIYPTSCKAHKNIIMIINAFNKCKNREKNLSITIEKEDSKYYLKVLNAINGNRNIKLIGNVEHDRLLNYMQLVRPIVIFPSLIESWGLPLEEAMELNLHILSINRNYAHETLNAYTNVTFVSNTLSDWTSAFESVKYS